MHTDSSTSRRLSLTATVVLACSSIASAHPGHGGMVSGFTHPITGLDHLLAMVGVGMLAAGLGKRALWALPLAFVGFMVAGAALGTMGWLVPSWIAEQGIALSVVAVGVMIVCGAKVPVQLAAALVAMFAVCHGSAHAAELPEGQSVAAFFSGFIVSTALLHAAGIGLGLLLTTKLKSSDALRWGGATIGLAGLMIVAGVI